METYTIRFVDANGDLLVDENHSTLWDAQTKVLMMVHSEYFVNPVVRLPDSEDIVRLEVSTPQGWKTIASIQKENA